MKSCQSLIVVVCALVIVTSSVQGASILIKTRQMPTLMKPAGSQNTTGVAEVDAVLSAFNVQRVNALFPESVMQTQTALRWMRCDIAEGTNVEALLSQLQRTTGVEAAQPNRVFQLHYVPNDPLLNEQYALTNIKAFDAWDMERGDPNVLVAVIDTGVDYEHPDLRDNLWLNKGEDLNNNGQIDASDFNGVDDDNNGFVDDIRGWDFTDAPNYPDGGDYLERDNDPMDGHGHGTGVAGIVAARADNNLGVAGLAHGCRVMNLRAFNSSGYGEEDDVASAILYAIANGARVVNMSFGDVFVSRVLDDVIQYGYAQGVVMVSSAGNSSTDAIHYPSGFAETISVGATDDNDERAAFSNFGSTLDVVAPGSFVLSTTLHQDYHNWSGTSFSAPYVAAAAALVLSQQPDLDVDAVRAALVNTADDLGDPGWDATFAAGRLNVQRALHHDAGTLAQISTPRLDAGFSEAPISIIGSAWSPDFDVYRLYYGQGDNPDDWIPISQDIATPVIEGPLFTWTDLPQQEGEYTLRLEVVNRDGSTAVHHTRFFLDWSPPVISNVELLPMLDADRHSVLVQFETDDLCEGSVHLRSSGDTEFTQVPLTYRTRELRYNLSQSMFQGQYDLYVQAYNGAGLSTDGTHQEDYYPVDLSQPPVDVTRFSPGTAVIPFGRLFRTTADFNQNGVPEIITSIDENGAIGPIKIYEDTRGMKEVFSTDKTRIPRDVGDADNDGKLEILCGFGFNSYLYESSAVGNFPDTVSAAWEGDGVKQFWASRIADLDQDGRGEIIMRVIRPLDEGTTDEFEIWETTGDNQFESVAALPNPTDGENFNGVPHSEFGDFDGDGRLELLLGDSDGDLYIYENNGDNTYVATWQDRLPLLDSIAFFTIGDFDGDAELEFAAGCHSDPSLNTEHYYDARHWYYRVYDRAGDNSYSQIAEWRVFGFESTRDFLSSLSAGDVDNDGDDEIFVVAYPDFYVFDYADGTMSPIYHHANVQSSATLVTDSNLDGRTEFWMGNGTELRSFESVGQETGPATPVGIVAQPLDGSTVALSWRAIENVSEYAVFKGNSSQDLNRIASVAENHFLDNNVETDSLYFYAVQSVDPQKDPPSSRLSKVVSARPGSRPALVAAFPESRQSVRLRFSEPMNQSVLLVTHYTLEPDLGHPTSVAHDKSGREVVLTFRAPLPVNEYNIRCSQLFDRDNTPLDSLQNRQSFRVSESHPYPYIVDAEFSQENTIDVMFNLEMSLSEAELIDNYLLNGEAAARQATLLTANRSTVRLSVEDLRLLAVPGDTLLLRARNLSSAQGRLLKPGRGDAIQLVAPSLGPVEEEFSVYPNPFVADGSANAITFANLRQQTRVQILSEHGKVVKTLLKNGSNGDLDWDLTNDSGDAVASGIYLYRIIENEKERMGKLAIVR